MDEDEKRCCDIIKQNIKNNTLENLQKYDFYEDLCIYDNKLVFVTRGNDFEFKIKKGMKI